MGEVPKFELERNLEIVRLHDEKGWSFLKIGEKYGFTKQRAANIYHATKLKIEKGDFSKKALKTA
jgi:hypothetical protein